MVDGRMSKLDLEVVLSKGLNRNTSQDVEVLFYQNTNLTGDLQKRGQTSKSASLCPPDHRFLYSRCAHFHSPRVFSVACRADNPRAPAGSAVIWGECHKNEICIEGRQTVEVYGEGYRYSMAYCVDHGNFEDLAQLLAGARTKNSEDPVRKRLKVAAEAHSSFQAVLTTADSLTMVNAKHFSMQAQKATRLGNIPLWRQLRLGDKECEDCSSLGLDDLPTGTERIQLDLQLGTGTGPVKLYLGSTSGSFSVLHFKHARRQRKAELNRVIQD